MRGQARRLVSLCSASAWAFVVVGTSLAWGQPASVKDDPLVRMPGSQPAPEGGVGLEGPGRCLNCHAGYNQSVEPGFQWQGSMMAHAARDFLFFACLTTAAQDSQWAIGRPNATDICLRCHFPKGWLEGRSEPTNATAMTADDWDGVQCDFCHTSFDPFFETTYNGTRESSDWLSYWDETNASSDPSQPAADATYQEDKLLAQELLLLNANPLFVGNQPFSALYDESGSGQYYVSPNGAKRASFADAAARHQMLYSRYHKSKYFCATCHDVSNPILANLDTVDPLATRAEVEANGTILHTEANPAYSYYHVERTFSEFQLSAYGQQGGAPGKGPFAPDVFETSSANNYVSKCQDCHMRDVVGVACNKKGVPVRPNDSVEHPESGQPLHDLTGGNVWVSSVLASAVPGSPNYDATNDALLNQGPAVLTLDLNQGLGINPVALLAGADRARQQLLLAASIEHLSYDAQTGALSFRVQNQTGHKLISGFPEGRRMFVNIKAYDAQGAVVHEVNPYDDAVGTLKGLPHSHASPALGANEIYADELVYEMHPKSDLTGEDETFHFALATGRYKDNRIPPKGFRIAEAAERLAVPVWEGQDAPGYYTSAEYAGGYDDVSLQIATGAASMEVNLYYQTTSREYIEFLRDEINGDSHQTLPDPDPGTPVNEAYIVQTDPFFTQLRAWGDTIWQLWSHNKDADGARPFLMTQATLGDTGGGTCSLPAPTLESAVPGHQQVTLTWIHERSTEPNVAYNVYYDQADKAQFVATVTETTYVDTGLTDGQEYCYKVTFFHTDDPSCESGFSNVICATPNNAGQDPGQDEARVDTLETGRYEGRGQNKTFVATTDFTPGDQVVFRARVVDASTGLPLANATVDLIISGPESVSITSGSSDAGGVAEATWNTQAPNKKGQGGTTTGGYTATVTDVSASGYTWDSGASSATFTIQ